MWKKALLNYQRTLMGLQFDMAKQQPQDENVRPLPRYYVTFSDAETQVQIQAGTDDVDKFTKTDLMKMVKAFKDEVKKEEGFIKQRAEEAERRLNEDDDTQTSTPNQRGSRNVPKGVRRPRKVRKQ